MTATATREYNILGETFTFDELQDIANHGANTGVHGFTYSSELYELYERYGNDIDDRVYDLGYTIGGVMLERDFHTLQEYKEWACWVYLQSEADNIVENSNDLV